MRPEPRNPANARRILVVGPSWVGDMVMAQSLLRLLVQPGDVQIDVLAPRWSRPLLERMPEVHAAIDMPLGHGELGLGARYRLGCGLRESGYAQAIVLPNSLKSALVPFWARIPLRTGYTGEWRWGLLNDVRRLDQQRLPMTVQRFVALGLRFGAALPDPLPHPSLQVRGADVDAALDRLGLTHPQGKLLILCPGAEYGPSKRWPAEHFATVARSCAARGAQVWLLGSERDAPVSAQVARLAPECCVDLAGRTRLAEAIDLMSLADVVVSNDSGLMHVAAALGRRLVAVYGSSDPGFTPPLDPHATVLRLGLECSPCFRRECPLGHFRCMRELHPEQVLAALGSGIP